MYIHGEQNKPQQKENKKDAQGLLAISVQQHTFMSLVRKWYVLIRPTFL